MHHRLTAVTACGTAAAIVTSLGLFSGTSALAAENAPDITESALTEVDPEGLELAGARAGSQATSAVTRADTTNLPPLLRAPAAYGEVSRGFTASVATHVASSSAASGQGAAEAGTAAEAAVASGGAGTGDAGTGSAGTSDIRTADETVPLPDASGSVTETTEDGIAIAALSQEMEVPEGNPAVVGLTYDEYADVEFEVRAKTDGQWSEWSHIHVENFGEGEPGTDPYYVAGASSLQIRVLGDAGVPEGTSIMLVDPKKLDSDAEAVRDNQPLVPADDAGEESGQSGDSGSAGDSGEAGAAAPGIVGTSARGEHGRECTATGGCTCPECAGAGAAQTVYQPGSASAAVPTSKKEVKKPTIRSRKDWGADESLRAGSPEYTSAPTAAVIHHTDGKNDYDAEDVPSILRGIYTFHVKGRGWADVGYNVLADKYGRLWEGRAGGVAKPVLGAHAQGYNSGTFGISVLGDYSKKAPPRETRDAVAQVIAWKLAKSDTPADGKTTSGGERMTTRGGHRDVGDTDCPGEAFYDTFGEIRKTAVAFQEGKDPVKEAEEKKAAEKAEKEQAEKEQAEKDKADEEEKEKDSEKDGSGLEGGVVDGISGGAADLS